jgi:photosystem II stability/assembly factor-like uncharacterized protein
MSRAIVVGDGGWFRLLEGAVWSDEQQIPGLNLSDTLQAVAAHSAGNGQLLAVGKNGRAMFSPDHGATWASVAPPGVTADFTGCGHRSATNDWYIVGGQGLIYVGTRNSTTGAFSWTPQIRQTGFPTNAIAASPSDMNVLYVASGGGSVLVTNSGGF